MTRPTLTIVTQWYPPEQAPFGRMMLELAQHLAQRGWSVTVVTGFPNHPGGVVFDGYRRRWLLEEATNGVRVLRVWLATSPRRSMVNRIATFITFTLTAALRVLLGPRPNIVFAVLQPLSFGLVLPVVASWRRARLIFNLQDLHPDTQIRLGILKHPLLVWLLRAVERHSYRHCDGMTVICEAFKSHAATRGAGAERIAVIPNWIDTDRVRPEPELGAAFRSECGLGAGDFVVLWAGTIGFVSGAMVLVDAAAKLRNDPRIRFLMVGEGPMRHSLEERARQLELDNIRFVPFQREDRLSAVQSAGDVSVVTLLPELANSSVPSKVLAYLAAGRPVIAAVPAESETASLVRAAGGIVVAPHSGETLAEAIRTLAADAGHTRSKGHAARDYAVSHLSLSKALAAYERYFQELARQA
jgi:colanic acid biosynthesis glycosyl transferase WcaI